MEDKFTTRAARELMKAIDSYVEGIEAEAFLKGKASMDGVCTHVPLHLRGATPTKPFFLNNVDDFEWLSQYFAGYHGVEGLKNSIQSMVTQQEAEDLARGLAEGMQRRLIARLRDLDVHDHGWLYLRRGDVFNSVALMVAPIKEGNNDD